MNIQCKNCHSQFNIPDHKIPEDRDAALSCPKCKEKIVVSARKTGTGTPPDGAASGVRPETAVQDQPRALILALEGPFRQPAMTAARQSGYAVETAPNPAEAIKKMAYHVYPLIMLEDRFDPDGEILPVYMHTLDMSVRRSICLLLMGRSFTTGDPMTALHVSVNAVIGPDNLSRLSTVLSQTIQAHTDFYRVYMDSMKAAGKA